MEILKNKSSEKPLKVILEKSTSEKVLAWLWGFVKIGAVLFSLSIVLSSANVSAPEGLKKTYFDGYFRVHEKKLSVPEVAIVDIRGDIIDAPLSPLQSSGSETLASDIIFLLQEISQDQNIQAVLLRIDSPGGTVLASEKITQMVHQVRQKKPIFALLESSATSGGYYVASASEKIFAYPSTITGSIGVILQFPQLTELMQKIGVQMHVLTSGDMKAIANPFQDFSPDQQQILQALITEAYESFVAAVAEGRGMEIDEVRELADGRIYTGKQAVANGLADELVYSFAETLEQVATEIGATQVQAVRFELPLSPWEQILMSIRGGNIHWENAMQELRQEVMSSGVKFLAR